MNILKMEAAGSGLLISSRKRKQYRQKMDLGHSPNAVFLTGSQSIFPRNGPAPITTIHPEGTFKKAA
jgi:hypothetical protein